MSLLHSKQTPSNGGVHVLHAWEYTTTTARDAAAYVAADIGRAARVGTAAPYEFYVLTNPTGPAWVKLGGVNGGGTGIDHLHFGFNKAKHGDTTYHHEVAIIFAGTAALGTPTSIDLAALVEGATSTGWIRIYDQTNSQVIAEVSFTNQTLALIDMGTLANLPTAKALWELQIRNSDGVDNIECYACNIWF